MSGLWIVVVIFVIFAIGAGAVQAFAALADRRRAREVANDDSRIEPDDGRK
ncbi:hypothetical protein P5P86_18275 [Nocardioides sp. BP30]|uniref:hypothetical protein n=1 Tax=Nocardioides sp. BP30 TaxID=3036374 RepID=UPI0024686461|nr:hypothetical protein [Nocardioides sp. BP30]WGL51887.1 hypothetical protein P5P86_18275 [Nocardioides sp. BP30]